MTIIIIKNATNQAVSICNQIYLIFVCIEIAQK